MRFTKNIVVLAAVVLSSTVNVSYAATSTRTNDLSAAVPGKSAPERNLAVVHSEGKAKRQLRTEGDNVGATDGQNDIVDDEERNLIDYWSYEHRSQKTYRHWYRAKLTPHGVEERLHERHVHHQHL